MSPYERSAVLKDAVAVEQGRRIDQCAALEPGEGRYLPASPRSNMRFGTVLHRDATTEEVFACSMLINADGPRCFNDVYFFVPTERTWLKMSAQVCTQG